MRFAYMDETGNTGRRLDDVDQPTHMIVTLAIDERQIRTVHEHMREIGRRHFPDECDEADFEFHGSDIFSAAGPFKGRSPQARIEIFDKILSGIALAEGEVIIRGVDKAGLAARYAQPYHPHDVALMFTIESIGRMARSRNCHVLLVADEAKEVEDAALRDLVNYQELGTSWGWRPEKIERIVDTIHFVPSHRNPAIQLIDCTTYIAARVRKIRAGLVGGGPSAEAVEGLWETRILPYVRTDEVWFPNP